MLHTFDTSSKYTKRRQDRLRLIQEMERRARLGPDHVEIASFDGGADDGPKRSTGSSLLSLESARRIVNEEFADDASTQSESSFVFGDKDGNYDTLSSSFRSQPYREKSKKKKKSSRQLLGDQVRVNDNLHEVSLGISQHDYSVESDNNPQHGDICTRMITAYHSVYVSKGGCSRRTWYLCAAAFAMIVLVGLTAAVVGKSSRNDDASIPPLPPSVDTPPTTQQPTTPPERETLTPDEVRQILLPLLLNFQITNDLDLYDQTSPQAKALEYMITTQMAQYLDSAMMNVFDWTDDIILRQVFETYALSVFYYSTKGPAWKRTGWTVGEKDEDPYLQGACRFTGVQCHQMSPGGSLPDRHFKNAEEDQLDSEDMMMVVTGLNLTDSGLEGLLPTELGVLVDLEILDLSVNRLKGGIPSQWKAFERLTVLNMSDNELQGNIDPDLFRRWSLMRSMSLYHNFLTGAIPDSIGDMADLEYIYMEVNRFTGPLPPGLMALSKLRDIKFRDNQLRGVLPTNLGYELKELEVIDFSENSFEGEIPTSWTELPSLLELHLSKNQLTGTIPEAASWNFIVVLSLSRNKLSGSLPPSLTDMTYLIDLDVSKNSITGKLPEDVNKMKEMRFFQVHSNEMTGTIPAALGDISTMEYLALEDNKFVGVLPESISNLNKLQSLTVHVNWLEGEVSEGICNLKSDKLVSLTADCEKVTCTCCTECF
uniref:L domain-like protein n=1 Tax=Grammatophora oceanica TaxID=210454 RepID=A0A7S1VRZ1_9STRA|mmetsp:Transcript_5713/g.8073  ORF Transcript_5713/g.8073 Transcript_5713/m.8073 type:complete len:710 (+) Transcript_5713:149-2278(+)|eukprot:CAMPEP_0194061934 /NCGR_PEP_ID=MMETSP0009_2-20130614/76009_1 /TAXON_ID=210454 /ORGANISM="Grammatophora oceanica, Strain CCMP 410" /LENGTH=709 /DNA_ID=CAMNT_0038713445 /DNA_START=133 /DNA_END=2262 /DNA_ORIENTATION=+